MTSPASLRELYHDPSGAWSFAPPPQAANASGSTPSATAAAPQGISWSSGPRRNSIFDLSPSLDFNDPSRPGVDATDILKAVLASAMLQYTSAAIAMPWEVGKLLLQVQWVPRETGEAPSEHDQDIVADSDSSEDDDSDSYFADPNVTPTPSYGSSMNSKVTRTAPQKPFEDDDYVITVGSADGVWGMIKQMTRFRGEGWLGLWKGVLTSTITEFLSSSLQPVVHSLLTSILFPSASAINQPPILVPIASHLITGFLLSPLDLIRTRLIVQPLGSSHRTYSGPINALRQIIKYEGGFLAMYTHPHLLWPTLLDNALRPMVSLALPGILASYLSLGHITEESSPMAWGFIELGASCLGLLATLPIETVRRRLQVQQRFTNELSKKARVAEHRQRMRGCVQLRPRPYNGMVDCAWHVLTEERSDLPIIIPPPPLPSRLSRRRSSAAAKGKYKEGEMPPGVRKRDEEGGLMRNTGIGQLYRGLGMRLTASIIMFSLTLLGGGDRVDSGWAEL